MDAGINLGMPHKGWRCVGVHDLGDGVGSGEEIDYAACEMCGNERIRFVHVMEHPDCDTQCEVGCICAEKLSDDYAGPKRRESAMKNRATRRARWLTRQWRVSAKGNRYLNIKGINVGVRRTGKPVGLLDRHAPQQEGVPHHGCRQAGFV